MTDISQDSAFLKLQNPGITNAGLSHVLQPSGADAFARLDFAFALGSIDLNRYHTFKIDGIVSGGGLVFSGGNCGAATGNGGIEIAVYAPNDFPSWSTQTIATGTTPTAITTLELPLTSEFIDTYAGQKFIHVAMLATDAASVGGAQCSKIEVDQLTVNSVP